MLVTKSFKGNLARKNNSSVVKSRKKIDIDYGTIFKFIIYGALSCQAGLIFGYLMHLIY